MNESQFLNMFRDAESYGFLSVPILVPPMIEEAFGYRGRRQYVVLGFGVHGGVMGDLVGDAGEPVPADLYRKFLLHPAIKPHTNAFRIEIDPPAWLKSMDIGEFESRKEDFESWSKQSRCLLLDRERRQFSVGSVHEVRSWLILRGALCKGGQVPNRRIPGLSRPPCRNFLGGLTNKRQHLYHRSMLPNGRGSLRCNRRSRPAPGQDFGWASILTI